MTKTYRIAAIPADGIGIEVIAAGIEVLDVLAEKTGTFRFQFDHFDWGSDYYKKHGVMMPADGREQIRNHDAIYFGAVGAPTFPITSPCGACGSRSANPSTSTPTSARPGSCRASPARCATSPARNSTG